MTNDAQRTIRRARRLVGTAFRPQGREPRSGLDCVGLAALVYRLPQLEIASDYRLRGDHLKRLRGELRRWFRAVEGGQARPGDLLLFEIRRHQLHLGISSGSGCIHADARLRRVVETPGELAWDLTAVFRSRARIRKSV